MILGKKDLQPIVKGAEEKQFQPNGVDVRVDILYQMKEQATFCLSEIKTDRVSDQIKEHFIKVPWMTSDEGEFTILYPGKFYLFDSVEEVTIPDKVSGHLKRRSSCNRIGVAVESGWYDSGFEGVIGGSIKVEAPTILYRKTRVAQLILWLSDNTEKYEGQWQQKSSIG